MLTLLKETEQENWPLIPSLLDNYHGYPTIAKCKANPTGYVTIPHGVYLLEFLLSNVNTSYDNDSSITIKYNSKDLRIDVNIKLILWLKAFAIGNVVYNGTTISVIGKFVKNGKQIHFVPLQEEFK